MADAAAGTSLKDTFKKVNHWRHRLMDLSMIGMAIGGLVTTGGAMGLLNPVLGWAQMHFSGLPALLFDGPEFLADAFSNAADGVFLTDTAPDMSGMHDMGGGMETHADAGFSDIQETQIQDQAERFGVDPDEYKQGWMPGHTNG